ncbi:MAG: hypothetical protein V4695_12200 [Pseudomonadota bacterium]
MATIINHHGVNIVTMEASDPIGAVYQPGDIVLEQDESGWWTRFVNDEGLLESYDVAFESYQKALWTAKAAAEFQAE